MDEFLTILVGIWQRGSHTSRDRDVHLACNNFDEETNDDLGILFVEGLSSN